MDGALVNVFICWRSVDPKRRTHMRFMTSIHQALVNNTFDTTVTWGPKALQCPEVSRRISKSLLKHKRGQTPPAPIVMMPKVSYSPSVTTVRHELVVLSKTQYWQNKLRRKEVSKHQRAGKRCVQCRKDGVQLYPSVQPENKEEETRGLFC